MPHPDDVLGARFTGKATRFRVPTTAREVAVVLVDRHGEGRVRSLERGEDGAFVGELADVGPGTRYLLRLDGRDLPDPFARFLPDGVHGPAEVVAPKGRAVARRPIPLVRARTLYELHVGTFTPEGTFDGVRARLDHLATLGVDAIELMPNAAFAGTRGWGYDGVALLAPHAAYGRPEDLVRLVDAAHERGLAVLLDVVLNHLGPAGSYLGALDPGLFDPGVDTPWGAAPQFAHPTMRALARTVVRQWIEEYGFDGLRLDATHAIAAPGEPSILVELAGLARALPGPPVLIAEDDRNEPALVRETGLDGLWADDFHHAVHVLLTREQEGWLASFPPGAETVARCLRDGFYYVGQTSPAHGGPRGAPLGDVPRSRLVYCLENHDQVGNRAHGERLRHLVGDRAARAATLLLAAVPSSVLLFQGQEWGASSPFLYFTDHEPELGAHITKGRREELGAFSAFADPAARDRIPDPQAPSTRDRSVLRWDELREARHASLLALHRAVLTLRREHPVLSSPDARAEVGLHGGALRVRRVLADGACTFVWNVGEVPIACPEGRVLLASWEGGGSAYDEVAPGDAVLVADP